MYFENISIVLGGVFIILNRHIVAADQGIIIP